jgi:electron transfer flavoprotein alpha subunit
VIIVYVETDASGATEMSREAITFARDLSAAGGGVPIDALVVGELPEGLVTQLGEYGVRHVHHAVGDAFAAYSGAAWAAALQAARETAGSVVVTASGTPRGMEILAHVAARLGVPMAANVISFGGLSRGDEAGPAAGGVHRGRPRGRGRHGRTADDRGAGRVQARDR